MLKVTGHQLTVYEHRQIYLHGRIKPFFQGYNANPKKAVNFAKCVFEVRVLSFGDPSRSVILNHEIHDYDVRHEHASH